jgi:type VI secretion system Hcp family effector
MVAMVARTAKIAVVVVTVWLVVVGWSTGTAFAEDAFARITGTGGPILGDQPNIVGIPNSLNAVQILSTTFGLSNPVIVGGGSPSPSRPTAAPVSLIKRFDRASPKLLRAAFTGELLNIEIIWFMNINGVNRQTVTLRLDNAVVTNMQASANLQGNDAAGVEEVTVAYQRITFTTPTIDAKGVVVGTTSVCLDLVQARTC